MADLPPPHRGQSWYPSPSLDTPYGYYRTDRGTLQRWEIPLSNEDSIDALRRDWNECNPVKIDWKKVTKNA